MNIRNSIAYAFRAAPIAITLAVAVMPAAAATVKLPCVRDNTLFFSVDGSLSNGAGGDLFTGTNNQGSARRTLVFFDVVNALPPGATVTSATLTLLVTNASDATARNHTAHRALADWGEGSSISAGGGGAASTTNDATWIHTFFDSQTWSIPGGDFVVSPSATTLVAGTGPASWSSASLTADVAAWLSGAQPEYGWVIQGDELNSGTARRFASREATDDTTRPVLEVEFETGMPTSQDSWSHVKALY